MVTEYRLGSDGKVEISTYDWQNLHPGVIWLDAVNPGDGELERLSGVMGFDVPNRHDMTEIELSSRLYKTDDSFVMIANLLPKSDTEVLPPRPAAFIMRRDVLLTVRFCDFFSFGRVDAAMRTGHETMTPQSVFTDLLDEAVSDRADDLEFSMRHMEELTSRLFQSGGQPGNDAESPELEDALRIIGGMGERVANIRESIASLQRVLNFARTYIPEEWLGSHKLIMESMRTDLTALSDEAAFFMNKLSFNLDATLGMINIDETKIIRILSIVTLVLSPPMVIAGIYGMNFAYMPELNWPSGYFLALAVMGLTALGPLWYLKKKKWL